MRISCPSSCNHFEMIAHCPSTTTYPQHLIRHQPHLALLPALQQPNSPTGPNSYGITSPVQQHMQHFSSFTSISPPLPSELSQSSETSMPSSGEATLNAQLPHLPLRHPASTRIQCISPFTNKFYVFVHQPTYASPSFAPHRFRHQSHHHHRHRFKILGNELSPPPNISS